MSLLVLTILISLSFSVFAVITSGQAGAAPTDAIFCKNEQRCKEIDEVWASKISYKVGGEGAGKVWDFSTLSWKTFAELYPAAGTAAPTYTSPPDTTFGLGEGGTSASGVGGCYAQAISSNAQLAEQNLKEINFQGKTLKVHKFIVPLFNQINQEIEAAKSTDAALQDYNFKNVGTMNWRCVRSPKIKIVNENTCMSSDGKEHQSKHSYGTAIDINPTENPFCEFDANGNLKPDKDCKLGGPLYDLPKKLIEIFKSNDFDWGGEWQGAKDYMHFVWKGNIGDFNGDGKLENCPTSTTAVATGSAKVFTKMDYDSYFIKYGKQHEISPALVKAISSYEAGLNPFVIGPAGEVGLLQMGYDAAKTYFGANNIVKCCEHSASEKSSDKNSCEEERAAFNKVWKDDPKNPYKCNPANDQRFNPELNIDKGTQFVKKNYGYLKSYSFATEDDKIKLTIAAHHLGPGSITGCIKGGKVLNKDNCKADISGQLITWEIFSNNLPDVEYEGKNKKYKPVMDNYVGKIYPNYVVYQAQLSITSFEAVS